MHVLRGFPEHGPCPSPMASTAPGSPPGALFITAAVGAKHRAATLCQQDPGHEERLHQSESRCTAGARCHSADIILLYLRDEGSLSGADREVTFAPLSTFVRLEESSRVYFSLFQRLVFVLLLIRHIFFLFFFSYSGFWDEFKGGIIHVSAGR